MTRAGVFAVVVFGLCSLGLAQQLPEPPQLQMPRAPDNSALKCDCGTVVSLESFIAESQADILLMGGEGEPARPSAEATVDVKSWFEKIVQDEAKGFGGDDCFPQISKYGRPLLGLFEQLHYPGRGSTGLLYHRPGVPLQFCTKDGGPALVVTGVFSQSIYNTLKTDGRGRAAKEFHAHAVPVLLAMRGVLSETPLKFYAVIVVYAAKDFLDDSPLAVRPETLVVMARAETCADLSNAKITEDEFAGRADVFLKDVDAHHLLKVKLNL